MSQKNIDPWVRIINVTDPVRHKKGYTLYKVTSKVFPKNSIEAVTQVTVWKRYNDFKKLHKALFTIHQSLYLKDAFPLFAKARFFGRFDDCVIEERRKSAFQLLEFAAKHPALFTSQVFVKFFEGGQVLDVPTEAIEKCEGILQPLKSDKFKIASHNDLSMLPDSTDSNNALGGIWQHRQAADEISLSSQATEGEDEDDRTTFTTDDDHNASMSAADLSEFDPLLDNPIYGTHTKSLLDQDEICNSWLLSALQSCAQNEAEKTDLECSLVFPRPFLDSEDTEATSIHTANEKHCSSLDSLIVSDVDQLKETVTSNLTPIADLSEFDPLLVSTPDLKMTDVGENVADTPVNSQAPIKIDMLTSENSLYILNAAQSISTAQNAELAGNFVDAFTFYKTAINILLKGVKEDVCPDQRNAVRKKIIQYLMRAEEICENHLPETRNSVYKWEDHGSSSKTYSPLENKVLTHRSVQDLAKFRVLGIINRVLLVLDTTTNKTCIVKTLYKNPSPKPYDVPNIVPLDIPFIVRLYEVYETGYALFLILEYASGGRVWDYVCSYFQRSPLSQHNDCEHLYSKQEISENLANVYSGKNLGDETASNKQICTDHVSETIVPVFAESSGDSADSDLKAAENCPSSYVALFTNYVSSVESESNVRLAKCNIKLPVQNNYENEANNFHSSIMLCSENDPCMDKALASSHPQITNGMTHNVFSNVLNSAKKEGECNFFTYNDGIEPLVSENEWKVSSKNALIGSFENNFKNSALLPSAKFEHSLSQSQDVDAIISNSKALLKNVDSTLHSTQYILFTKETTDCDKVLVSNKTTSEEPDVLCSVTSLSKDNSLKMNFPESCSSTKQVKMFPNENGGQLSAGLKEKEYGIDSDKTPSIKPLVQHAETRTRLSSSTGDLDLAFSQRSTCFTEAFNKMDAVLASSKPIHLPEPCIYLWAAQITVALDSLHKLGIIWQDLRPDNILLGTEGHILLSYQCQWNCVDHILNENAKVNLYAAPEIGNVFPVTPACDWWSLGAILFELLTGKKLIFCHPSGITDHTNLSIPDDISSEASDILKKFLKYNAAERLGSGSEGIEDIKSHPFFRSVDWESLYIR